MDCYCAKCKHCQGCHMGFYVWWCEDYEFDLKHKVINKEQDMLLTDKERVNALVKGYQKYDIRFPKSFNAFERDSWGTFEVAKAQLAKDLLREGYEEMAGKEKGK